MDEVERLCARMLGDGPAARAAVATVVEAVASTDEASADRRIARLRRALTACRDLAPAEATGERPTSGERPGSPTGASSAQAAAAPADEAGAQTPATGDPAADAAVEETPPGASATSDGLRVAVARELAEATAGLAERQRALLALRDLLGLGHDEIGQVLGGNADEVALGLAHARIALRERLRGPSAPAPRCVERDRALRAVTRRLDGEPITEADEDWIIEHLGLCSACGRDHASMLEASACYRAWPVDESTGTARAAAVAGP